MSGSDQGLLEPFNETVVDALLRALASENASRLAAMQRADRNIDDLLARLDARFRGQRQRSIDAELFDVTAGYVALQDARPTYKPG